MIEPLQGFPENILAFAGRGQVTKADYVSILIPAVNKAFSSHERLRFYYELGADFAGLDAGTMVEDFKVNATPHSLGTGCGCYRHPVDRPCDVTF